MSNSQQSPDQPSGDGALAATMNDVSRLLDNAAASGVPAVIETADLRALGLLEDQSTEEAPLAFDVPSAALDLLVQSHGCEMSGPYFGDGEVMGAYYLFEHAKAA